MDKKPMIIDLEEAKAAITCAFESIIWDRCCSEGERKATEAERDEILNHWLRDTRKE